MSIILLIPIIDSYNNSTIHSYNNCNTIMTMKTSINKALKIETQQFKLVAYECLMKHKKI